MDTGSIGVSSKKIPQRVEEDRDRGERLKEFLFAEMKEKGALPFFCWMEHCLYHPEWGYYRSKRPKIGKDGDYYTGPCVHPLFGYLIGKQLAQMADLLGGETFDVVEMGGGRGFLCEDILRWIKEKVPFLYSRLKYTLIEASPHFLNEQRGRLAEEEKAGRVTWMSPEEFEKGENLFEGCILSNELIDAFPVHPVILDRGGLKELFVTQQEGQFGEEWREPSNPKILNYFHWLGISLEEGQRAEVNLLALDWMERVARCLKQGFVLTIDYGYRAEELYAPFRACGTLLCYYQHQTSENPYDRPGEQDITSHVNFTGLIQRGEEVGLSFTGLVPQYRFLLGLGFLDEMAALEKGLSEVEGLRLRLTLKHLIEPEMGMGEVFKVLIQHKGIESPHLDGLREL